MIHATTPLQTIRLDNQASRLAWLAQSIPQIPGSGIVYVLTKRDAEQVATWLSRHGISAQAYHSQAGHNKRLRLENMLLNNKIKVLVATTALGMGYDKPDLSFVIHYQAPSSVVAYYQQVGRAGRAIPSAVGILLSGEEDEQIHNYFRRTAFPPEHMVKKVLDALEESDGKSTAELQKQLNMRKSQIDQVLKVLSVEIPSPAIKVGSKWHRTAAEFELDRERIHRLSVQREREWQEFQEYVDTDNCFMEYLGYMLDDPTVERCGKCANCMGKPVIPTTVGQALEVEAVRFLRRSELPFEPRKSIRKGTLPTYGFPNDRLEPIRKSCQAIDHLKNDKHRSDVNKCLVMGTLFLPSDQQSPEPIMPSVGSFDDPSTSRIFLWGGYRGFVCLTFRQV